MKLVIALVSILAASQLVGCASSKGATPAEKRAYTLKMRNKTLRTLYEQEPEAKRKINASVGYGVFSNIGTNVIFVSTGGGYGVVHNNKSGDDTYMKMGELGVGLGLGVKDFRAVLIFYDEDTLNDFVENGWEWGGEADAAAKTGDQGGEASGAGNIDSDIEVYQITENGIALSATISGTKYWKDDKLNE